MTPAGTRADTISGMAEIIDYGQFHERLDRARQASAAGDSAGRWQLLREFQEEWGYQPSPDAKRWERWEPDEHREYIQALKSEHLGVMDDDGPFPGVDLSLPIPRALDEWWDLPFNSFADRYRLYFTHPIWPPTVIPDPSGYVPGDALPDDSPYARPGKESRVCAFTAEYEYCNIWGYPAALAHEDDPVALISAVDDDDKPAWLLQAHSISEFFLLLAVNRLLPHFAWTVEVYETEPALLDRIGADLTPLGFEPYREMGAHTLYYGGPDLIVCHETGQADIPPVTAYGRTPEALRAFADAVGVDWSDEISEPESMTEDAAEQPE